MPEEEQKQPVQQPTVRDSTRRRSGQYENAPSDSEILKASGARPSPSPDTDPKTERPINKAADLTNDVAMFEAPTTERALQITNTEIPEPTPTPQTDSGEGEE